MKYFSSIFHEENIQFKKQNPQDTKMTTTVSVSQRNYPKLRALISSESENDNRIAQKDAKEKAKIAASSATSAHNI